MKLFQQRLARRPFLPNTAGESAWSASDVPNPVGGTVPIAMTKAMIDDMIGYYVAAARRVKEGRLNGVDVHVAHGYLPSQFFLCGHQPAHR